MRVGVVLIHYHTPDLARRSLDAVLADAQSSGLDVEAVVVDNGSTADGLAILQDLPARLLQPERNLGYAAGINLGIRQLPPCDAYVVMNPDVLVEAGCLPALCAALDGGDERGAAVAGPCFFWDRVGGFRLPPIEPSQRRYELLRWGSTRWPKLAAAALRQRWRRHAQHHWQAERSIASHALSGALLAIAGHAWRRIGPFDEGFRLYFEETEWLQRARRLGFAGRYVPQAHAVHLYAQSTPSEPKTRAWFEASETRFRQLRYGSAFSGLLQRLGSPRTGQPDLLADPPRDLLTLSAHEPWPKAGYPAGYPAGRTACHTACWLEISPSPLGIPAAARRLEAGKAASEPILTDTLWQQMAPGDYFARLVDDRGQESATCLIRRPRAE